MKVAIPFIAGSGFSLTDERKKQKNPKGGRNPFYSRVGFQTEIGDRHSTSLSIGGRNPFYSRVGFQTDPEYCQVATAPGKPVAIPFIAGSGFRPVIQIGNTVYDLRSGESQSLL